MNRAYGTATERVDFPSSLPHTTGIEEVVLSSLLKRMSNLQTEDRLGGKEPSPCDIRDFNECCQELDLMDLNSRGCRFTCMVK